MGLDAGIYGSLRQFEAPSYLDSMGKAANLSSMAMQQGRAVKQMEREDAEFAQADKLRKASEFGRALDSYVGLSPQERAKAYPRMREQLVAQGVISPETLPEQEDPSLTRQLYGNWRQSAEAIEMQLKKSQIAKNYADARSSSATGPASLAKSLSPGEKKADEEFAKDASEYYYSGGRATVDKNMDRLEGAIAKLRAKPDLTGGLSTKLPWFKDDDQQDWINPELAAVRDDVRSAIQTSLKQILGGQFTEKEAVAMFNRAFNPRLSAAENIARAQEEMESLRQMSADKDRAMAYFRENKTLAGFTPAPSRERIARNEPPPPPRGGSMTGVQSAAAGDEAPSGRAVAPGSVVMVMGKHYRVGPDGDTLEPIESKSR